MVEEIRARLAGRRCLVVGSAPLDGPIVPGDDECIVAVNGGMSSVPGVIDLWLLNSRRKPYESWGPERVALNEHMVCQGAGRTVRTVAWVTVDDEPEDAMVARLRAQRTEYAQGCVIARTTRERIETVSGARTPAMRKHALSAGMFAVALCFWSGAAAVRMVGFSWRAGYAYLPGVELAAVTRGHIEGDRLALEQLLARYGDRLEQTLTPGVVGTPAGEEAGMATNQPTSGAGQASQVREPREPRAAYRPAAPAPAPAAPRPTRIKVRATKLGYYGERRRRPGDVFVIDTEQHFSKRWMETVDPSTPERSTSPSEALRREHANLTTGRTPTLQKNAADLEPDEEDGGAGGGAKGDDVL